MNVLHVLLVALLCGAAYAQGNSTESPIKTTDAPVISTMATTTVPTVNVTEALNCTTTWKFPGKCVVRLLCDNNTPAIDLTPYSLRGTKKICPKNHTCCPLDLIITPPPPQPPKQKPNDHKFDFDDDD